MEPRLARRVVERMLERISKYVISMAHASENATFQCNVTQLNVTNVV